MSNETTSVPIASFIGAKDGQFVADGVSGTEELEVNLERKEPQCHQVTRTGCYN